MIASCVSGLPRVSSKSSDEEKEIFFFAHRQTNKCNISIMIRYNVYLEIIMTAIDLVIGLTLGIWSFPLLYSFAECHNGGFKIDASTAVVLGQSLQHTSKLQTLR